MLLILIGGSRCRKRMDHCDFIQDLQPVKKVNFRNSGIGPCVNEFAEAYVGWSIYSVGDRQSRHYNHEDSYQACVDVYLTSRCNELSRSYGECHEQGLEGLHPGITMSFLDDILIKGCSDEEKDESKDKEGCRKFVVDHMKDCKKVLQRLEIANLTFLGEKSAFGQPEILVVCHLCGAYGRKPSPSKVNAIQDMKEECITQTKVRMLLGACTFYH